MVRLCFTNDPDTEQLSTKSCAAAETHPPWIHGENRPLMFSWCERACAVCGWRSGMYGWNAGTE